MATPIRGSVPNTRWPVATLTWEELRSNSGAMASSSLSSLSTSTPFVALPPRPTSSSSSSSSPLPVDPARVRQDDAALTSLLHRGVLTGGRVNAILGLADGGAGAARVGAPRGSRGGGGGSNNSKGRRRRASTPQRLDPHSAAIEHLRQPRWDFAKEGLASPALAEEEEARQKSETTRKKKRTPEEVARGGIVSVRMAWGNAAEAAALRSLARALRERREEHEELFRGLPKDPGPVSSSVALEEVGMLLVSDEALAELLGGGGGGGRSSNLESLPLPPLAASPDALIRHCTSSGSGTSGSSSSSSEGSSSSSGSAEEQKGNKRETSWLEPVEVKCVCPFRLVGRNSARRSGGRAFDDGGDNNNNTNNNNTGHGNNNGNTTNNNNNSNPFARFELRDPGPRPLPPASAMPQLQLQMLACNSRSALLVSHSATRGGRVWRVARDDGFLRRLLEVASRAFERHVVAGEEPSSSSSSSSSSPGQHAAGVEAVLRLADAAVAIAASAKEVALLPAMEVDLSRAFLQ